ncbi:MAG: hypothetical protein WDO56_07405 [Gammaproteobacteria bacterium]
MRPDVNHFTSPRPPRAAGDISRQLRDLPVELAPPYDWAEFRRRGRNRLFSRTSHWVTWPHAAAAAGLTAVVAAVALWGTGSATKVDGSQEGAPAAANTEVHDAGQTNTRLANADAGAAAAQARETREWLARQPAEPVLVRAGPQIVVANLEDRIAWFDDVMTDERLHGASSDHMKVLQQERARVVSSLAQVRYAEALAAGGS